MPARYYLANVDSTLAASLGLGLAIVANNVRVALLSKIFSPFVFGTFAFLVPAVAFRQIGFVASVLTEHNGSWLALGTNSPLQFLLMYVLPHGIIKLSVALLMSAGTVCQGLDIRPDPAVPAHWADQRLGYAADCAGAVRLACGSMVRLFF